MIKMRFLNIFYLIFIFNLLQEKVEASAAVYNDPLPVPTLIREHGFLVETHKVITEDEYILTLHRIPNHGKPPVLLNHDILGSSAQFVVLGPHKALAYELHHAGFDVWMGNNRGNYYSKDHVELNTTQYEFWQFGVHEMGVYDLPAEIDYILDKTNSFKLNYIGYSLGSMYYWILMSEKPEYNAKINQMHALAPIAFWGNEKNRFNFRKIFMNTVLGGLRKMSVGQVLPITLANKGLSVLCGLSLFISSCSSRYLNTYAQGSSYIDKKMVPLLINHYPAGISAQTLEHTVQLLGSGKFRQFDYGKENNLKLYDSNEPPEYNLSNVATPVYMQYTKNDTQALPMHVKKICSEIQKCKEKRLVPDSAFVHADFIWASNAKSLVYDHLIETLKLPPSQYV